MLSHDTLVFLYELSQNNNKTWFEQNKSRYEKTVKKPFEATTQAIIDQLAAFEPEFATLLAKNCIFRIYRDTRFSTDKTPYKTHIAASFSAKGKQTMDDLTDPGYYLHLEYGSLMLGGGAYSLDKLSLYKIRTAIMQDPETFRALLTDSEFVARFGEIKGERNKVLPPEFKEAAQLEPLIAMKQFYFMAEMDPEEALRPDFPEFAAEYFRAGQPLNNWLRRVLAK